MSSRVSRLIQRSNDSLTIDEHQHHKNLSSQNLKEIPVFMFADIISLDISFNSISDISSLQTLKFLRDLNLDSNEISENATFPYLPFLETLSLSSNKIQNYPKFIATASTKYPVLIYLSLLKNPCCRLEIALENSDDYKIYRYFIISTMKNLEYLDISAITKEERKQAQNWRENSYTPLNLVKDETLPSPISSYSRQRYTYLGAYSEGNRFIKNEEL